MARQKQEIQEMQQRHAAEMQRIQMSIQQQNLALAPSPETQAQQRAQLQEATDRHARALRELQQTTHVLQLRRLQESFAKHVQGTTPTLTMQQQTLVAPTTTSSSSTIIPQQQQQPPAELIATSTFPATTTTSIVPQPMATITTTTSIVPQQQQVVSHHHHHHHHTTSAAVEETESSLAAFQQRLRHSLDVFWKDQLDSIHNLPKQQTEQDFKTHNDLPLARIKRIMKSDEDVRMISAEAPVLFAKACECFILELTLRSWSYSQHHKRRTLQKEDIVEAIQKTDIFDFLVDVIH